MNQHDPGQKRLIRTPSIATVLLLSMAVTIWTTLPPKLSAQDKQKKRASQRREQVELTFPPALRGNERVVSDQSLDFLKSPTNIRPDVTVATKPPWVEFAFFPGQTYRGKIWSNWGDSLAVGGKYYASIGDHAAPIGNAFVYRYDPLRQQFDKLVDLRAALKQPEGHYTPGKIHGRLDLARDGWLYFATHRGSARVTNDANHYQGDWILRADTRSGRVEVLGRCPVPRHSMPTTIVDPQRLIMYAGTAAGENSRQQEIYFVAYDLAARRTLFKSAPGPSRAMLLAESTGRVYFTTGPEGKSLARKLQRFDPRQPTQLHTLDVEIGIRAATRETADGTIYVVSQGARGQDSIIYAFDTKTETARRLATAAVGTQSYVASLDVDPTGRYLYYVPGAHGGSDRDGAPLVRFDTKTQNKHVVAFLHPFYQKKYGFTLKGTYSVAIDPKGDKVFVTWNISRGSRSWDCCGLTVVHLAGGR